MDKKPIRLTEQDLHMLVENAVRTYLVNEGIDEISWSGIKNMARAGVDKLKQVGNTMGAAYYNGAANAQIQKLNQLATQYQEKLNQIQTQIATLQQKAQGRQDAATQNATNFNNRFKQWNTPNYQVTTNG
jgi:DNA anti-recombination protein RmuC